jgi:hypothetical protein
VTGTNGNDGREAAAETLWRVVTDAENLDDICRGFVFSEWSNAVCWGAYIYSLGQDLELSYEAGFGRKRDEVQRLLADTDFSELDRTLREKAAFLRSFDETSFVGVPLIRLGVPIGLIIFVTHLPNGLDGADDTLKQVSRALGFSLAVFRLQNQRSSGPANRSERKGALTPRHETIRIYGFFNVGGRYEAITVARGAGYLT